MRILSAWRGTRGARQRRVAMAAAAVAAVSVIALAPASDGNPRPAQAVALDEALEQLLPGGDGGGDSGSGRAVTTEPVPLVGFNQQWNTQAGLDVVLNDADLQRLRGTGATAIRIPVRCHVVRACAYERRYDDGIDYTTVGSWDFRTIDAAVDYVRAAGLTPIIAPHPGDRMWRPGWIVDDDHFASTTAFVDRLVTHLHRRFGPLVYSLFESELDTSLQVGADGVQRYRYATAAGFPSSYAAGLAQLYAGDITALNRSHGTSYRSFSEVPVPDLGSSLGVDPRVYDSPATHDLRRVIGSVSAARYSALGDLVHRRSPGSEWWGPTVQLQSLHDGREVHTARRLTAVGPTLSDLASQPGIDVLSVDGYRNNDASVAAAEWRVAAKLAARAGKKLAITEIGAQDVGELRTAVAGVLMGASNLRAVLVWQAKDGWDRGRFGLLTSAGLPKSGWTDALGSLFSAVKGDLARRVYVAGDDAVYYPEWALQVVQNGKGTYAKTMQLMADLLAEGRRVEPVVDEELVAGIHGQLSVFSFYVRSDGVAALARRRGPTLIYQYAAHRTGYRAGGVVDTGLWPSRYGFRVSPPERTRRVVEDIALFGSTLRVTGEASLGGWPFVHLLDPGANRPVGEHRAYPGLAVGLRAADGSVWLDHYPGRAAIPLLYGD